MAEYEIQSERYVDGKGRPATASKHGGMRAAAFIFVVEALENMAFISNATNLVRYFSVSMHYSLAVSANMLTNYMGTSFLLTLVGGFISDSFITRFSTIVSFASAELLGLLMLTLQAHFPALTPPPCGGKQTRQNCEHPTVGQAVMLYTGLYMVAVGMGAVKAALPAHGADQFDDKDPTEKKLISHFFNWYFFSLCVGSLVAVTLIVWVQENVGWEWGFGLSTGGIFLALVVFVSGFLRYRNKIPSGSPVTRIAKVLIVAIRNRKLSLPRDSKMLYDVCFIDSSVQHTEQFRFLDKAAIPDSSVQEFSCTASQWRLCTLTQVEETKSLLRMLPIFASTIMMNCCLAQLQTFSVQQGSTMDRTLNSFKIPAASLTAIPLVFMVILVPLYDQLFVPLASRITGHESGITHLQRVGIGLFLSALAMAVAALVELKRKGVARDHSLLDTDEPLPISVLWLGWQYLVLGIADMFTLAGLLEFFYSQAPSGMRSLSTALSWCSISFGYYLSSVLVSVVNKISARLRNGVGWLSGNNLNHSHLELFYMLLCILTTLNFFHYLAWARWYKYKS
jgi:peptide/histidine transporter 3/4